MLTQGRRVIIRNSEARAGRSRYKSLRMLSHYPTQYDQVYQEMLNEIARYEDSVHEDIVQNVTKSLYSGN